VVNVEAGLEMSYNLCNLPKQITATDGTTIKYTYFADGTKFKTVDAVGSGFVYTGSLKWSVENGVFTPESVAITMVVLYILTIIGQLTTTSATIWAVCVQ
jgi:hypothetical protein